jgi:L-malate glycosyltransferase
LGVHEGIAGTPPPLRILFVNHTGSASGAENAMLRLLAALPPEHERAVVCPPGGALAQTLQDRGVRRFDLAGTRLSFALHPLRTALDLARLARSALAVARAARAFQADVIHANSIRAGLIALLAHRLGGPPVVVQCHDHLPRSRAGDLTRRVVARGAEVVVAVTDTTAARFNDGLPRPKATRVYISVDHSRFHGLAGRGSTIRSELGLGNDIALLVHVAQITPWKGQDTSIRALSALRDRVDAHLLIVGEVAFSSQRFDNSGFNTSLRELTQKLEVEDAVHFLGQRSDVPALMATADLLLLPSWDEPFGLVVAEAMACCTPPLATNEGGVGEYVIDGVNGRLLPPHDPGAWASAAVEVLRDRVLLDRMGQAAAETAGRFNDERYTQAMLDCYRQAVDGPRLLARA